MSAPPNPTTAEAVPPPQEQQPAEEPEFQFTEHEQRTWNDNTGKFCVLATFLAVDGDTVSLEREDGTAIEVPFARLSTADQEYVDKVSTPVCGKVILVTEGDLLTVSDANNVQRKIRLEGIDAPERTQSFGSTARDSLVKKVFQQDVEALLCGTDRYGRALADVYLGDRWINRELVEEGCAWHYEEFSASEELAAAESKAKAEHAGLWRDANAMPPWEFRSRALLAAAKSPATISLPRPKPKPAPTATAKREHRSYNRSPSYSIPYTGGWYSFPSYRSSASSGTVHVRGYYRKDGTYVRPHTRSRPRR